MNSLFVETLAYNVDGNGNNFSKLFSIKTNLHGENMYNDLQIIFKLIHFTSNKVDMVVNKIYALSCKKENDNNSINFVDLNSEIPTHLKCVYTVENDILTVYVKGCYDGASVKCYVEYANNLGYFTPLNYNDFNYSISSYVEPSIINDLLPREFYKSNDTININLDATDQYSLFATFKPISNNTNSTFNGTFLVNECVSGTFTGFAGLYYISFNKNVNKSGFNTFGTSTNDKILNLVVKKKDNIYYFYLKSNSTGAYGYANLILKPILYEYDGLGEFKLLNECKNYNSSNVIGEDIINISSKTFSTNQTPNTKEQNDLIGMINELKSLIDKK